MGDLFEAGVITGSGVLALILSGILAGSFEGIVGSIFFGAIVGAIWPGADGETPIGAGEWGESVAAGTG
jgi:hypothetical protein